MFYVITLLRLYRYSNFNWLWGKLLKRKLWQIDFWCSIFMWRYRPLKVCILYSQEKQTVYCFKTIRLSLSTNNLEISIQLRRESLQVIVRHILSKAFCHVFNIFSLSSHSCWWHMTEMQWGKVLTMAVLTKLCAAHFTSQLRPSVLRWRPDSQNNSLLHGYMQTLWWGLHLRRSFDIDVYWLCFVQLGASLTVEWKVPSVEVWKQRTTKQMEYSPPSDALQVFTVTSAHPVTLNIFWVIIQNSRSIIFSTNRTQKQRV